MKRESLTIQGRMCIPLSPPSRQIAPWPCPAEQWGGASAGSKNLLFTGSRTPAAAIQPKESQHFKKGGGNIGLFMGFYRSHRRPRTD
jgi:hypothetical protein